MPDPISWQFAWPYLLGALVGGYLIGSVPFGLLLTRLAGLGDIRSIGSGNIGTTNVLRTGRKDLAAATLLLDGGKGAAAVLLAGIWGPDTGLVAALGALLGHLFPLWLKFKGGKGVATTLGTFLGLSWPVGVACCLTWLVVAGLFRYSSLSALVAMAVAPFFAWLASGGLRWAEGAATVGPGDLQLVEMCAILAALVWFRHHQNLRRLIKGEEPKIGRSKG
jgi:glycerol-3-phosphate acyltransferase PlsY